MNGGVQLGSPAPPLRPLHGLQFLEMLAGHCSSWDQLGKAMAWLLFNVERLEGAGMGSAALTTAVFQKPLKRLAMHRGWGQSSRPLIPLPSIFASQPQQLAESLDLGAFCALPALGCKIEDLWTALSVCAVNGVAGWTRAPLLRKPTALQERAIGVIRTNVKKMLADPVALHRSPSDAEKELASRFVTYTGEEVPKMQVISVQQILPALPPVTHSGTIDALELVSEGTKRFLLNPTESLLTEVKTGVNLKSRVHVKAGDELSLALLLVERRICVWVPRDEILRFDHKLVLNGMFAVGKGSYLESGGEIQRLIMNLVPTNSVLRQAQGAVADLPGITQYLSLSLDGSDQLSLFQSDMSAAFYLFRIPPCWNRLMSFNISFPGRSLGFNDDVIYHLGCAVIPMGWGSSVTIMQEIADRLTTIGRLPASHQVRRTSPLPLWLVDASAQAVQQGRAWFHVYLDNFCAMERVVNSSGAVSGTWLHEGLEGAWSRVGILSSAKKKVSGVPAAQELGALIDGSRKTIGGSGERILRLIQSTLVVISKVKVRRKWVQVVVGRWVHLFSFRRPLMVVLDEVWKCQQADCRLVNIGKVRAELFGCCMLGMLLLTDLSTAISSVTTASDASSTGGAVGFSRCLTSVGSDFVAADRRPDGEVPRVPIMVISLFNGIGCTFRCYDLCGVLPLVGISFELAEEANRITSRRWPWVLQYKDVKSLTPALLQEWRYRFPQIEEIHVWGGFPCVDLSSVRYNRRNLEGESSRLFWEFCRILKDIRYIFGFTFPVLYFAENVASMDREAEQQISEALGTKPYRVDCADATPIHRPRFCWSNVSLHPLPDVELLPKPNWTEVNLVHEYPSEEQWLEDGAVWGGTASGTILPTCMKSMPRFRPPPRPAGLHRVDEDSRMRWIADEFRFPPYQYDSRFIIWVGDRWRLASASEREVLHGLGLGHTELAWSAGRIKDNPKQFEDVRKSLVGDGFSCFSFVYFAAMACFRFMPKFDYHKLVMRMGLAPGFTCPLHWDAPMGRCLSYGSAGVSHQVDQLHRALLRRVNHTGSDVRIASGLVMRPRSYPRQSVASCWWKWEKAFAYRWSRADHINSLEFRSIVHAMEWRIRHLKEQHCRVFHVTDSYVAMSIASKGRTSSKMLRPLLQRLAASLVAFNLYLIVCHVESSDNPTDAASRR